MLKVFTEHPPRDGRTDSRSACCHVLADSFPSLIFSVEKIDAHFVSFLLRCTLFYCPFKYFTNRAATIITQEALPNEMSFPVK